VRTAAATGVGILLTAVALALGASSASAAVVPAPVVAAATPAPEASTAAGTDQAQEPAGEAVLARVRTGEGEDVAGVDVTAVQDGDVAAEGTTDASGSVELAVPGPGAYDIELDVDSLPAAVEGLEPRQNPISTQVEPGQDRTVAFRLEEAGAASADEGRGSLAPVLQRIATGLRFGLVIALAAIGLSMIFGTTGLTNFAHSELITFGALSTYFAQAVVGLPFLLAAVVGVVASAAFGLANDRLLWQPLRRRGTGLIAMMIISIGLSLFLRYLYLYFFGGSPRTYEGYSGQAGVDVLGLGLVRLRPLDLVTMALSAVILVVVALALVRTRLGKATRAVADNPALAAASGIDVDRVIRTVWIVGTALAGLAGIFLGLQQGISYLMGFQILLLVFAAVTLGGLGTAFGAVLGALVVGLFIELSTLVIPNELQNLGALVILIVILLVRPQGILGRAQRVG